MKPYFLSEVKEMNNKGFTLVELIMVVAIIGILSMIAIPAYIGQQSQAARTEAFQNLEALRLFEEQLFSETAAYAAVGACGAGQDNIGAIQAVLPGFQPGPNPRFSYCITTAANCFTAQADGNDRTRVAGEQYTIDCTNAKNY